MKSEEEGNPHKPSIQFAKRKTVAAGSGPSSMTAISRHCNPYRENIDDSSVAFEKVLKKSIVSVAPESSSLGDSSEQTGGKNNVSEGKRSIGLTMNFVHKGI